MIVDTIVFVEQLTYCAGSGSATQFLIVSFEVLDLGFLLSVCLYKSSLLTCIWLVPFE